MAKRLGKDQVDLQPIGDTIKAVQGKLKALRAHTTNPILRTRIQQTILRLNLLHAKANLECCDQNWGCPNLELAVIPGGPPPPFKAKARRARA